MERVPKALMAALLLVAVLVAGCGQSSVRLGWVETSSPGHLEATYDEFTGVETRTVSTQPGETLYLEYDARVERGRLQLEVGGPLGEPVWCVALCNDCGETRTLPATTPGCYSISVQGEATEGSFNLKWEQR